MSSKELILQLFNLPPHETIFQDFSCAYQGGFLQYGRLFVCENHICFYANVIGSKNKIIIKYDNIEDITKKTVYGFIQNAIKIKENSGKSYKFCSFSMRDQAFQLMNAIWKAEPLTDFNPQTVSEEQPSNAQNENIQVEDAEVEVNFVSPEADTFAQDVPLMNVNLPITVDKFFELFISDNASYSLFHFHERRGDTDITISKWEKNQEDDAYTRELKCIIKLTNVPFKDKSRLYKVQTYLKNAEQLINKFKCKRGNITVNIMTKTLDVPFGTFFQTEEKWTLEQQGDKCLLKCYAKVVFLKSFYLKKTIESRARKEMQIDYEKWIDQVKKTLEKDRKKPTENNNSINKGDYEESKVIEGHDFSRKSQPKTIKLPEKTDFRNSTQLYQISTINLLFLLFLILILLMVLIQIRNMESSLNNRLDEIQSLIQMKQQL